MKDKRSGSAAMSLWQPRLASPNSFEANCFNYEEILVRMLRNLFAPFHLQINADLKTFAGSQTRGLRHKAEAIADKTRRAIHRPNCAISDWRPDVAGRAILFPEFAIGDRYRLEIVDFHC